MKRTLHIEISSLQQSLQQFGECLERTMQGNAITPYAGIGFETIGDLLAILTPERLQLIEQLKRNNALTSLELAQRLERSVESVGADVAALEQWGLIEKDDRGRFQAPWDAIEISIPLAA